MTAKKFLPSALAITFALLAARSVIAAPPAILATPANTDSAWTRDDAAHLLRRAAFSGTPQQIDQIFALGKVAAVDYLLTGKLPPNVTIAPFPPVKLDPIALPKDANPKAEVKRTNGDIQSQWVARMIQTDRPLEEKMTLFWHGLFTSGIREVKSADQMLAQNKLFHDNALGNYKTLALAIIHDPAMLIYLNNNENVKGKPNENLARKFCELFTMGEGQGYTEKDVGQIARALTGATVVGGKKEGTYGFKAKDHDTGLKTIFGKTGNFKPDDVVELVFQQPEPPEHLARRLWEFFAYPDPTDQEIAPVAAAIRDSHFEVAPALRAMFLSPDFYSDKAKFSLIKSPPELLVSTIRILGEPYNTPNEEKVAASAISSMGQTLLEPPNVRGWPGGENWITAATLFSRYNTAAALVDDNLRPESQGKNGKANKKPPNKNRDNANAKIGAHAPTPKELFPDLPATPTAEQVVNAAVARFLQRPLHPEKVKVLVESMGAEPLHLGQASTDARIREMIGLLLSTPEYQVE